MKVAVLYYSFTGNTESAAKAMAEACGADLYRIQPEKDLPRNKFLQFLVGGYLSARSRIIRLKPLAFTPAQYDLIVVCSPTWAGRVVPAVRSFLTGRDFSGRTIALFGTCAGDGPSSVDTMRLLVPNAKIAGDKFLKLPAKLGTSSEAAQWLKTLIN